MTIENQSRDLPFAPSEDPFVVEHGGFYRRWFSMIDDIEILKKTVFSLKTTTDESWVPAWSSVGKQYEDDGELLLEKGDIDEKANTIKYCSSLLVDLLQNIVEENSDVTYIHENKDKDIFGKEMAKQFDMN